MTLPSLKGLGIPSISLPLRNRVSLGGTDLFGTQTSTQAIPDITIPNIEPLQIATDIIHGIARSGGAVGLQLAGTPELPLPPEGTIENKMQKIIFGPETLKSLTTRIAEGEQTAIQLGIPSKAPLGINPALLASGLFVGGTVALDFSGVGGEAGLGEKLLKETTAEGASKLLNKIGVSGELLPKYSKLFAEAKTPEEVSGGLKSLVQETKEYANAVNAGKIKFSEIADKEAGLTTKAEVAAIEESLALPQKTLKEARPLPSSRFPPEMHGEPSLSPKDMPSNMPSLSPKVSSIGEEVKGAIDRFTEAIQTAKPARKELEKLYTVERSKRAGAVASIFEQAEGQKGYFQALGKLKGELAPAEKKAFEMGGNLIEQDVNSLFKAAQINPASGVYEKLNTQAALTKVLSGVIPTNSELSLLEKTYGSKLTEAVLKQRTMGQKILAGLGQLANLPRTVMASFDLSAPFRQGLMLVSHPKAFGSSFLTMFRQFGSEEAYKAVQESITKMPEYALMKQGKLALTDIGTLMTNREEKFMASWAEKIPVLKYPIKASNRAYTGFLNKLRADVFTDIVKGARAGGRELDDQLIKGIADFVNTASGRGSKIFGVPIGNAGTILNGLFFSPRLMASRITMLNPISYVTADPIVRKEMLKSVFTVLGSGLTVLGLAKMAGAKVGDNSNSSDFGKIVIGNTRIDIWGGFQQYVRMASQLVSGKYISTTTGKEITLGEGYKSLTRLDIATRQIESKEAPVLSFLTDLLRQRDYAGKPIKVPNEIASRFVPMVIGDMYDIAKDNPELLPASLLGIFGVGLQTYQPQKFSPGGKGFPGIESSPLKQKKGSLEELKGIGL